MDTCVKVDLASLGNGTYGKVEPVLEKYEAALLLLVGFGGISIVLALFHRCLRTYVFDDVNNVDTAFDAGGRVSTSLTAVTVASQFLWPGDFLQSATVTVKSGISGPLWYTAGAAVNIALFPVVSVYLKTRAPGVKTYLQIMRARYGAAAHVIFIVMALLVNLCVISTLIVAGIATIQSYTREASDEFCVIIIAILFGSYTVIGGLGTTFYVSYFNAVLIYGILLAFTLAIFYQPEPGAGTGTVEEIYANIQCLQGPEGNKGRSFMTFDSETGLVWALMGLCVTASITYCDQAAWQSRIAAKPVQGVLGFLIACYVWFAIPMSIATATGLAYLSMASQNGSVVLTEGDINAGLVTPFMAQVLLGDTGGIFILTLTAMALMSTGSGEVMAVSSIIIYDIYQVYIRPYRKNHKPGTCILCNCDVDKILSIEGTICACPSVVTCAGCKQDLDQKQTDTAKYQALRYTCQYHGDYRHYQDMMLQYKNWCILWVTLAIVPLGLLVIAAHIDLNFAMLFGFIITLPCFPPVVIAVFWSKASKAGVIAGAVAGVLCGMSVTLGVASTYEGGLGNFLVNAVEMYSVISGAVTSISVSFLATMLVSYSTTDVKTSEDEMREWTKLRLIDNPLHPWSQLYIEDVPGLLEGERPSQESLEKVFRKARILAYIGGGVTLVLVVGIVPGVMLSLNELSESQFEAWTMVTQIFAFVMATIVFVVAPVEEVMQVVRRFRQNRREQRHLKAPEHAYEMNAK